MIVFKRISYDSYLEWLEMFYEFPSTHSIGFSFSATFNLGQSDPELLASRDDEDILGHIEETYVEPSGAPIEWPVYNEALGG